jgi:hypothetical protein
MRVPGVSMGPNATFSMPHGKVWSKEDEDALRRLLESTPFSYAACARSLGRSVLAVRLRALKLRREPIRQPPPSQGPVQVGPVVIASFDQAILSRSLSTQTQARTEIPPPTRQPATLEGELRMAINAYTGELTVVRTDAGTVTYPHPKNAGPLALLSFYLRGGARRPPT